MNFTKTDMVILVTMALAVIIMSFMFPALGITNDDPANESNIPDYTINNERFQFTGDMPNAPGTPTQGTLWFYPEDPAATSENRIWIEGDTSNGVEMFLSEELGTNDTGEVTINTWESGNVTSSTTKNFTSVNDTFTLVSAEGFGLRFDVQEVTTTSPRYYEVDYSITQRPRDTGGFISSLLGTADDTAKTLVWVGTLFFWFSMFLVETGLNAIALLGESLFYLFSLIAWLVTSYTDIITAASGFASVFVAVPGILLTIVLSKLVFIGVSLLPTT